MSPSFSHWDDLKYWLKCYFFMFDFKTQWEATYFYISQELDIPVFIFYPSVHLKRFSHRSDSVLDSNALAPSLFGWLEISMRAFFRFPKRWIFRFSLTTLIFLRVDSLWCELKFLKNRRGGKYFTSPEFCQKEHTLSHREESIWLQFSSFKMVNQEH